MTLHDAVQAAQKDGDVVTIVPVETDFGELAWEVWCEGEDHYIYEDASAAVDSAMLMAEVREIGVFFGPEVVRNANSS